MSQISSPIASPTRTAASTYQSDDENVQLTPRSKVKALLAGLSDSEDDGVPIGARRTGLTSENANYKPRLTSDDLLSTANSEDEEDAIVAPKGRLAARLQAQTKEDANILDNNDEAAAVSEQERDAASDNESLSASPTKLPSQGAGRLLKRKRPTFVETQESENVSVDLEVQQPAIPVDSETEPVSRRQEVGSQEEDSGHESQEEAITKKNRFAALVEKKRAERLAKEAAEEAKQAEKAAARKKSTKQNDVSDIDSDEDDSESGARLTQKTRPTRKAGKKAMEEIARETQRISRNMQLAHEVKTKKKITKESLLARFRPKQQSSAVAIRASSSTANSSMPNSDDEASKSTPTTSPDQPNAKSDGVPFLIPETSNLQADSEDDLPSLAEVIAKPTNKGKTRAPELSFEELNPAPKPFQPGAETEAIRLEVSEIPISHKRELKQRPIRILPPKNPIGLAGYEQDDDLEIVQSKVFRVFDSLPAKKNMDARSLQHLRALARLTSPSKQISNKDKSVMTAQELASDLRSRARQQAAAERREKIEVLRSKGVVIQTAEERQQDQMQVEDMLEKARQEVEELTKKEKEAAKKEAKANGEEVEDSSEDEEYEENEAHDEQEVELSGSEDEDLEDQDSDTAEGNGLVDDAASEDDGEERDEEDDLTEDEAADEEELPVQHSRRRAVKRMLVDDDEEEENDQAPVTTSPIPALPVTASDVVQNPFGLQNGIENAPMGLTQAFAATMADSQLREGFSQEDSLLQLQSMPTPGFPVIVPDSAPQETQQGTLEELDVDLHFTQTQIEYDTLLDKADTRLTQFSELPDPTQDVGFEKSSPLPVRFVTAPASTIDTVIVPQDDIPEQGKKQGRLMNRQKQTLAAFSDEEDSGEDHLSDAESIADSIGSPTTAFNIMKKAAEKAKRKETRFNKGKSKAKDMFEEQAQESEDEYAGLGGASDDSEGEEDEETRNMIDEGEVNVDERKVAAFFAEKAREEDEAGISKLFKDINSGALRRKRGAGADFDDLDDSDDDHQARQARKRREFARMRKALLDGDSNIVKIAEDPKKMAFLRSIEDRDDDDDLGILESTPRDGMDEEEIGSQDIVPDSQSENRPPGYQKRKRDEADPSLPPNKRISAFEARRAPLGPAKKPATLADIRASVSFLLEEPDSMLSNTVGPSIFDFSSDHELELEPENETGISIPNDPIGEPPAAGQHTNPRRTGPRSSNSQYVDRLSLKRQESSRDSQSSVTGSNGNGAMAFVDPRFATAAPASKPPTLLRKATSSFSNLSTATDEHGISTNNNARKPGAAGATAGAGEPDVKGRGVGGAGSKRSSVNYYARAAERKAAIEKAAGGGNAGHKGAGKVVRRQSSGLSRLLGREGTWE